MARMNRIDIHQIDSTKVGVFREPFDRVVEIPGYQMRPARDANFIWDFQHPETQEKGRLLHVEGFLRGGSVALNGKGQAYLITRQGFTLGLLFPSQPRRLNLNDTNYKILPKSGKKTRPAEWPEALIFQIVRAKFQTVVIFDESFLLEKIGLRPPESAL